MRSTFVAVAAAVGLVSCGTGESTAVDSTAPPSTAGANAPATEPAGTSMPTSVPSAMGETTPRSTAELSVGSIGGGFDLLEFPFAGVADDVAELEAMLAASVTPVAVDDLVVDWAAQAVFVLAIPTSFCPPLLAGLEIADGVARPTFVPAGYLACEAPLLSHTLIAAVDRSLLAGVSELELPIDEPFQETDGDSVVVDVSVAPPTASTAETPVSPEFGDLRGSASLPPEGEVLMAALDDGTPVFVVHHHDGTVSALDLRVPSEEAGRLAVVEWAGSTRHFLARGAWDEYGRRVDGLRTTDMQAFATRTDGAVVEIGAPVELPTGTPIAANGNPPSSGRVRATPADQVDFKDALELPPGHTAWIDAAVVIDGDGAHICEQQSAALPIEPCPPESAFLDGIPATPEFRTIRYGPMLATRTAEGFERIATTGGYAGMAL